jgi:exonuclease SbcC
VRPLRVELEGFSTFSEPTEIDFGDADLVAFVGPTGSGKSSIIDAITFALYGSVSRYDDARLVAPVINQAANQARVRLDFELNGRTYIAVRIVRRTKTGATTREARLELAEATDDESPVLASGAKELTDAVEALLGLDFNQFTRTVVLPQGLFAQFLKDDPASRQKLLRRLLDIEIYSQMGARARRLASEAEQKAVVFEGQLSRYAHISPTVLADHQKRADALSELGRFAVPRLKSIDQIEQRLVELRTELSTVDADLEKLASVELPAHIATDSSELERLREGLEQGRTGLDDARSALDEARVSAESAGDVARLQAQIVASKQLAELGYEMTALVAESAVARAALASAEAAVADADESLQVAVAARDTARLGSRAADWISTLVVGEACPVCRQEVGAVPDHDPSAELAAAEATWAEAEQANKQLRSMANVAGTTLSRTEVRLDEKRKTHAQAEVALADVPADLKEALSRAIDAADRVVELTEAARKLEAVVRAAEAGVNKAEEGERQQRFAFGSQRDRVATLEPPAPAGESLSDDWSALQTWADDIGEQRRQARASVFEAGTEGKNEKTRSLEELAIEATPLGLDPTPESLPEQLVREQARVAADIEQTVARLDELEDWRSEIAALRESKQVNDALGQHLGAKGFERWLLSEALDDLVARATVRLRELSAGQYSLASDDGVFKILDHRNADEQRDVRTLSGGETFLASLALALALADSISELASVDAPRLGSMFLDEGFGTLDGETLDVVASAIEELSSGGRLVGIVTHIEALAERMPVQIVVSKGPTTSTVVRVNQ